MNKKRGYLAVFQIILYIAIGFVIGIVIDISDAYSVIDSWFGILFLILCIYISIFIQIITHELGHLIFGLLTGYHFVSFRIASFMLIKRKNKIAFCKTSIVGTGGQCLMCPPCMKKDRINNVLYNLGGVILNLLLSIICILLLGIINNSYIELFLITLSLLGIYTLLINGIPFGSSINNDGYNTYLLLKNREAHRAFWLQLKINEQLSLGKNLSSMPDEWFKVSNNNHDNAIINTINVFSANRLMEEMKFNDAYNMMDELLDLKYNIMEIYQYLMIIDCMYCELVLGNKKEYLDKYLDKNLQRFIGSMKNYPSILVFQYAYALLKENNLIKASDIKNKFEKIALKYPYPVEIVSNRKLMDYADMVKNNVNK